MKHMLTPLNKFTAIFHLFIIRALQFRSEMLVWLIIESCPVLVMLTVWKNVFSQQTNIKGFSLAQILQYYLLIFIIGSLIESHFESLRCQQVRLGQIDFKIIRPLSFLSEILWQDIASKLIYFLLGLPIFALIFLIWAPAFDLTAITWPSANHWLLFIYFLITSYLLNFLIAFWIVLGSFWMEGSQGLEHFKQILISVFSGMIPLAFLPGWMQQIAYYLPFKFMFAIPISLIQSSYAATWQDISYAAGTIVVMLIITKIGWRQAMMKYSSAGG